MDFNYTQTTSTCAFETSKPFPSQLGPGFIMTAKENMSLNSSGIHERHNQVNGFKAAISSETTLNISVMSPHKRESSKMQKRCPFGDKNSPPSSERITGKRSHPLEEIITPVSPQKRRRLDVAQARPPEGPASSGRSAANIRPKIPALLPIQHDSWYYLPEMWDYCGPDGNPIKARRWSPNKDGDRKITSKSDRLNEDGDRENATAATVATWVELNRLRARYAELLAEFHGGPLQVHHLADKDSELKMEAIDKASTELQKAMDHVGMASGPQPQFYRPTRLAPPSGPTTEPPTPGVQISLPVTVCPQDTLLSEIPPEEAGTAQPPARVALSDIPSASSVTPYSPEPPKKAVYAPEPALPMTPGQETPKSAPFDVTSSTKGSRRRLRAPPTSDPITPPAVPSASSGPLFFLSSGGQFRFTAAGEARFKLLIAQGNYDEAFGILPEDQQFEHLTTPDAISAFRLVHPRPEKGKKGKGNAVETELWVCRAKVKIERKELPKAEKSDTTEYEFDVVYSDEPCNGAASTHCNMVRHKKRTHLGRPYQSSATQKKQGGEKREK